MEIRHLAVSLFVTEVLRPYILQTISGTQGGQKQ